MNLRLITLIASAAAFLAGFVDLQGAIMSPEERDAELEKVRLLLANSVATIDDGQLAKAPNPFAPDLGLVAEKKKESVVELSDEEMLQRLSAHINPTGIFVFGDEYYLVFKEKKVQAGSDHGITYNNKEYIITITDINRSAYVVRYGDSELQLKLK